MSLGFFSAVKEGSLRMVPKHMADSTVKKLWGDVWSSQFWSSLFTALHIQPDGDTVLELDCAPALVGSLQEKGSVQTDEQLSRKCLGGQAYQWSFCMRVL